MPIQTRRRVLRIALGATALLTSGALAAQASAATLTVNQACYVFGSRPATMAFQGSGYTPGDDVLLASRDGSVNATATADATGNIAGTTGSPTPSFNAPGTKTVRLTATDESVSGGKIVGSTPVTVAPFGAGHGATKSAPGLQALTEKTSWSFSGFLPGKLIYGHFTIKGKQVALATYGRAKGPCGTLTTRARLYPATPRHKSYPVQWDDAKKFSKRSLPRLSGVVKLVTSF
jgi:hypothetical protein